MQHVNHNRTMQLRSAYPLPQARELSNDSTHLLHRDADNLVNISLIIPVFNEQDNLHPLYTQLKNALAQVSKTAEIIFIDDGSTDRSAEILTDLHQRDSRIHVIHLRRNFGQTAAFSAGFDFACGDIIVTMDGDLQNDPAEIPKLLEKLEEGYDLVSGWRVDRHDPFLTRRLPSLLANRLISFATGVKLHDYGCSLKAYRSDVVKNLKLYGEMHRFIPALASWRGVRVAEVPVNHAPRRHGRSKYGLGRTIRVILDLITVKFLLDYSTRPIQVFGLIGMFCFTSGTALGLYLSIQKLVFHHGLSDRPMLLLAVLLVMLGVQLITMGLLGELVVRTYYEAQSKPTYVIRNVLDADSVQPAEG